ncbi:MAG: replication-associated recombination protein A [Firmicutes bacterium]|jgi:putative ATPase|nr:replication-associated recombination protein A [Bacillota bacterium]
MELFSCAGDRGLAPLAVRMRPKTIAEYVGQEHILGEGSLLRRAIEGDFLRSVILYGPPGVGKTTLAYVMSQAGRGEFITVSATTTGVSELKQIIAQAKEKRAFYGTRTTLFIDEIQRLNKGQQDVLLPAVEDGVIILIGATTENPFFEVNPALLSRSQIYQLRPLSEENLRTLVRRAISSAEGLSDLNVVIANDALQHLITVANGDARVLLNTLEFAAVTTVPGPDGVRHLTVEIIEEAAQAQRVTYDKSGDNHYDVVSAFIKSMRGSDPDAALYWFARMIYANEDPRFIVRRIIVHASEDVGMADPNAMLMAHAAANALEWVGMPEARIPIAQAIIYIATAPKSNSVVTATDEALHTVASTSSEPVPVHLRDAHYKGASRLGHGVGYKYPHDYPHHYVNQQYMPANLSDVKFYKPSDQGREKLIRERLEWFAKFGAGRK